MNLQLERTNSRILTSSSVSSRFKSSIYPLRFRNYSQFMKQKSSLNKINWQMLRTVSILKGTNNSLIYSHLLISSLTNSTNPSILMEIRWFSEIRLTHQERTIETIIFLVQDRNNLSTEVGLISFKLKISWIIQKSLITKENFPKPNPGHPL